MNQGAPLLIRKSRSVSTRRNAPPSHACRLHGRTSAGERADLHTLTNAGGSSVSISTYGGTVVALKVPDRLGRHGNVVLGLPKLADYEERSPYFGCLIGRCGNRISKGRFSLGGRRHRLAANNNGHSLHGGPGGFHAVIWKAEHRMTPRGPSLHLTRTSPDGEEGYPGNLSVSASYTLTDTDELRLVFRALTDRTTVVNFTQHSYFNLTGEGRGTILDHILTLRASRFTPVDRHLIPTGEIRPVAGTPFDFRRPRAIGERIGAADPQLLHAGGYDHNWIADKAPGRVGLIARVEDPSSGRILKVLSDQPGIQFYSGNFLDGTLRGPGGRPYPRHAGFCLEPQHFPDSPNRPEFPSVVLNPGAVYKNTIIHRFTTDTARR